MSGVDPQLVAEGASLGGGAAATAAGAARAEAANAACTSRQENSTVGDSGSSSRWWWSAWTREISARKRRDRCVTKTITTSATTGSSQQPKRSSPNGVADSSSTSTGGGGPASSGDGLQQNSSRNGDSQGATAAHSSRTNSGVDCSGGSGGGSNTGASSDTSSSCVDASRSIRSSRWSGWCWNSGANRAHQQEPVSLLARLLRKGTVIRRETVTTRDVRGGRPTFERRRRRYRTVSWKYKKSIGFLASFVFLCNQILAPGLTSMPLTLIEYGWLPSLLVNLLFCMLSTLCSLVLLRSVTMIEGNHNFDERFEYSATLRHFLAPPTADFPAGAPAARCAASAAKVVAQVPTAAARSAAVMQGARSKSARLFRSLWHSLGARSRTERQCPLSEGVESTVAPPVATSDAGSVDGPAKYAIVGRNAAAEGAEGRGREAPAVTPFMSKFFAMAFATASRALMGFRSFRKSSTVGDEKGVSGSPAASAAHSGSGNKATEDSGSYRVFHPRSSNSSTRHSDYNQASSSSREEQAAASRVSCVQAVGVGLPSFLLRRALYSMQCLSEGQPTQQLQQQETALAPQQQVQEEELRELQGSIRDSDAAAAGNERNARGSRHHRQSGGGEKVAHEPTASEPTRVAKAAIATPCNAGVSPAANSETCHVKNDSWSTLKYSGTPTSRNSAVAVDAVIPTGTAPLSAARHYRPTAAQAFGDGLLQGFCFATEVWSWLRRCMLALLLAPLSMLRWLWNLPHRLLQQLHAAVVRPPPLLPSSFPRLLSWLLHINTFLSTCSAALLVAYCIDCLLLRVFSCSLFIPLLPTHVSSGAILQQHGDGWMFYCVTVSHWIGAVFALLLQPLYAIASLTAALFDSLAAVGAALSVPATAATAALSKVFTLGRENASITADVAQTFDEVGHLGNTVLPPGSWLAALYDIASVRQISKWLPGSFLSLISSIGTAAAGGFLEEQRIAAFYGVPGMPFLYVLPSQHHIEEVFSGVCSSSNNSSSTPHSSPPGMSLPYVAFFTASFETTRSDTACSSFDIADTGGASHANGVTAAAGGWGSPRTSAAAAAARTLAQECLPRCVSHIGISVGYIVTAAICLHLAAADLQENARMQLLSFGAIIAAVLQVSCSAALMLLFPTAAAAATPKAAAPEGLPGAAAAAAGMLSVTAVAGGALPATAGPGLSGGPPPAYNTAGGGMSATRALVHMSTPSAPGAALADTEGYSLACCAGKFSHRAAALLGPPTTPATCSPALACRCATGACNSGDSASVSAATAVAAATTNSAGFHMAADAVLPGGARTPNEEFRAESPWPSMIVRGSGMGALVSTFVDAYSYSNALPSWANEIKDNIPVTQTLFLSTTFACTIYLLFGVLCAAAFPAFSASSNVLAAMLPSCQSLVAASCICFFHIFALLPNIVSSQISRRYDLLNMAICLDKPSAFYVASTMPWMLYWLLTFSPVFATPSQLLTLLSNVLLNFVAPALVYVYALHATAPPRLHVSAAAGSISCSEGTDAAGMRRISAVQCAEAGAAATELGARTAETHSHPNTYAVGHLTHEEEALLCRQQEQEEQGEAGAPGRNWDWQRREPSTHVSFAASLHSVRVKESGMYQTTSSSASPLLSADVSDAASFTDGALAAPPSGRPHRSLQLTSGGGLDAANGGGLQVPSAVSTLAEVEEHGPGRAARRAAGDSLIGGMTMQAVPEEECVSEEEAHAAAVGDNEGNGQPNSSVPFAFATLHEQHSQGSILACSSGIVSRWSTSCFGDRRAAALREYGSSGAENFFRTQSSSGFKRTQSQNVLSFQARLFDTPEKLGSLRADAAGGSCVCGKAAAEYSLGSPSLQRRSTNMRLGQRRVVEALDARGGTAVAAVAGFTSSSQAGEKLGKMRVAGAVAGGGGARSREVQRQLQTWLEEYSRQMPESEVAQLLQRQQGEEQQEEMRLQQREAELRKDLRKKVENQWRRQHIFRADEELPPSPSYGGGCSPAAAATTLDTVPEQSRSASLPPNARSGNGAVVDDAGDSSAVSPRYEDREASGNSLLRRRSSRSLSCARFLLPQQPVEPGETLTVTSAVVDDDGRVSAAPGASTAASDATATSGGDRQGKQTSGTAGQGHQEVGSASGKDAFLRCAEGVSAGEEHPAERHAESGGRAIVAAGAGGEVRRRQSQHLLNHEKEVGSGKQQLAGQRAPERRAEGAGRDATRSWDTTTREDAISGEVPVSSNVAAASAVLVTDAILQNKRQPHQVPQNDDFQNEKTGGAPPAPAFVRRTTKRCARIDSVSVALQQRRRQQLLKFQQQQHVQEQHVEEQERLQVTAKEHPYEDLHQQQQKPHHCREQQAEVETRHQDEGLPRSDADGQQPFQRSSIRHATCISRGRAHGDYTTTAVKSCSQDGDAAGVNASVVGSASATATRDKADSTAEEMRETGGAESEVASSLASRGCRRSGGNQGRDSRNRLGMLHRENNLSRRSSISKDTGADSENGNCVRPSGCGLRLRIAAAVVRAAGWGNDLCCAVWAITQRKGRSIFGVDETVEPLTVDEGMQQQPVRRGIQLEVLQPEVGQHDVGAAHVAEEQNKQRDVREVTARLGADDSRESLQKGCDSSKASPKTSGVNHSYELNPVAAAPPTGAAEASNVGGETTECGMCSAAVATQNAFVVAEKATESSAAAVCASSTELRTRGAKEGLSYILPRWCRVNVIPKKIYSGIRWCLGIPCYGISIFWNVLMSRKLCPLLARGARDDVTLTRQQRQQQTTNGSQERVSFFPWLRSTEEQLVATYALLAVVLYCAAAALADEMWIPLEPAWLFIWRHSCRLLSLLWAVKWPPLPLSLLSVATWIGVTLHSGAAAAEHLLLLCRDSYIVGGAIPWVNVSIKKMQRLAGWLGRVSIGVAGRSVQQVSGAQGDKDEVHTFFRPLAETLQYQLKAPPSNEQATTAFQGETAARLGQVHSGAQVPLSARPALSTQALLYVTEELDGNVHAAAGLSAETFFIGLFLLIACTLPLLRYASPARLVGPAPAGSRRQRVRPDARS